MKYIACVLTFYAVLGLGSLAPAQHCPPPSRIISVRPIHHAPAVHHAPVAVVKKDVVVVKEVVPVIQRFVAVVPLVEFPSYSAVYAPPVVAPAVAPVAAVAPPPAPAQPDAMRAVLDALKAIDARLQKLEQAPKKPVDPFNPQAQQAPPPAPPSALAVVTSKCAACHNAKDAGEKGAGLVMLAEDGKLAALSDKAARKVVGRSYAGTMPPKDSKVPALTDEEVGALVAHYTK